MPDGERFGRDAQSASERLLEHTWEARQRRASHRELITFLFRYYREAYPTCGRNP
ncbi:MAG: hypothetical protein ABSG43_21915 [Solirubrobacteraceae bacterium]|jgi:hypothetical protein